MKMWKMFVVGCLALLGCDSGDPISEPVTHHGTPTGQRCPPGSTLTYANFGQKFMVDYCMRCHSSQAAMRGAAPSEFVFDNQAQVQLQRAYIDEMAARARVREKHGGVVDENPMPPDGAKPTDDERYQLAEWLACGAL